MPPSSPDEALHFRGKTLTPESPRPLHIAEPANIPVLQNQMDPVFNNTSTYDQHTESGRESSYNDRYAHGWSMENSGSGDARQDSGPPKDPQEPGSFHSVPSSSVDGSMNMNDTSVSVFAKTSVPSNPSAPGTTEPSVVQDPTTTTNPSLTAVDAESAPSLGQQQPFASDPSHTSQAIPGASELDNAASNTNWPIQSTPHDRLGYQRGDDNASKSYEDGVDFQNILDNLPPPSSIAPSAPVVSEALSSSMDDSPVPQAASDESVKATLSLPPRPPPQEKPSIHPNYNPSDDIRSYHQLPPHNPSTPPSYPNQDSNHLASLAATGAPGTTSGSSALPPPPLASFQKSPPSSIGSQDGSAQVNQKNGGADRQPGRPLKSTDEDLPWGREVQRKYDEFLHEERIYVTEGLWDRFPSGSRLFVGNLPTERVTKRDLFHIFHKYGKLAQISIKQAYGFIQFLESASCLRSLQAEQGAVIRGRKIHLEISKPQRNTRPGPPPPEPSRIPPPRRSRSPEFGRVGPNGRNMRPQGRLPFSDFRDEPNHRRRDDYRPPRSPSPRPFRGRDGYRSRDRTPERYDRRDRRRSRSPYSRDRRYRSPSPRPRSAYDGESDLPVPRRVARDVPEVQVLVLEEVDRNFIFHVENSFRNRGLRVDVLVLGPRIPLNAAVQRQIVEGVLAVVRLSRPNQFSRKIPLQVFDRTGGPDKVRFNEYPELDPNVAAEIVFHAQSVQRSGGPAPFPPNPAFGVPPLPPPPQIPPAPIPALAHPHPPNVANLISTMDGPALQSLLSTLQQRPHPVPPAQHPFPAPNPPPGVADLATLLSNATRQPIPGAVHPHLPPPPFNMHAPNAPVVPDPNLMSLLAKGLGGQQPPQGQPTIGPHVQSIVDQLTKWKQ